MTTTLDLPAVEPDGRPPTTAAGAAARREFRTGVVIGAVLLALAWPLGLVYLGWPLIGLLAAVAAAVHRGRTFPRVLALWFALLTAVVLSLAQVETVGRLMAFGYRFSQYAAATLVCLYLYTTRDRVSSHRVFGLLGGAYLVVVASGLAGLVFPDLRTPSLALDLLPSLPPEARFIRDGATMDLATVQDLLGTKEPRPKGVFAYTNDWAAVYALLTVVLFAYLQQARRLGAVWLAVAAAGVYPLVQSLSRGAWGALVLGLAVVIVARAVRGGIRSMAPAIAILGVGGVLLLQGPVWSTIQERLDNPHSNAGRESRIEESVSKVAERPLTGFGVPLPSEVRTGPSLGTHGQLWLFLFCQGYPGAALFVLWMVALGVFAVRAGPAGEPLLGALTVLATQALVYEWAALQLNVLLALAAITARHAVTKGTT